jgi:hypothetical protein
MWVLWWIEWRCGRFHTSTPVSAVSCYSTFNDHSIFEAIFSLLTASLNNQLVTKQEVLGRTNLLLSLIRHGPHWKRRVQQFLYCCVCIRYRRNISTENLPSNDWRIFTEPFPSNDKGIFTEPLPSNSKGTFTKPLSNNDRGIHRHTHTQQRDLIGQLYFSK